MAQSDLYDLPTLVGEQYMLTSVLRETRDTVLYRATQRELRREVIVECLRFSAVELPRKVRLFLDSAKAQAKFQGDHLSNVLEVIQVNDTWMIAKEAPAGEPLDMMLTDEKKLSALQLCELLIILCKLCLRLDAERVASVHFHLEDVFYDQKKFCLNNPALAGTRPAASSRLYLSEAARELLALLDSQSHMAGAMASLLRRINTNRDESSLRPALFLSELSRLFTLAYQG